MALIMLKDNNHHNHLTPSSYPRIKNPNTEYPIHPSTMKTNFLSIAVLAFATISGTAANPADKPMGVQVTERDGVTLVREVVRYIFPLTDTLILKSSNSNTISTGLASRAPWTREAMQGVCSPW